MLERRIVRVLVPYSRTLYFVDKGRERGLTADLARDFEQYLNTKYAKQLGKRPVTVLLIPTTRDKLLSGVVDGLGDIAAGNLTATDERQEDRRFRRAREPRADAGSAGHRSQFAADRDARGSVRQDSARAEGDELLRERAELESCTSRAWASRRP